MWDHPNPIFLDFETQSAADIKAIGGRLYAEHPSTRVLFLCWCVGRSDDTGTVIGWDYHLWLPGYINTGNQLQVSNLQATTDSHVDQWNGNVLGQSGHLWPASLKPAYPVTLHRGNSIPDVLLDRIKEGTPCVAHNAHGFDRSIWRRFCEVQPEWLDSMLLARSAGRPGSLDRLSKQSLGTGKDHAKKLLPLLTTAKVQANVWTGGDSYTYPTIRPGDLAAFIRYGVADVELMRRIWVQEFEHLQVEADVIQWNDRINERGIRIDERLREAVYMLSKYSQATACEQIAQLTDGQLHANNIRSTKQVHEWLDSYGVTVVDENGKPCLRKEVVQKLIDSPYVIEDHLTAAREIPPVVIQVLNLRLKALRITDAKLERAADRTSTDGFIRDLHSYHTAHTGRFSSSGVQIHNLPRPIAEIPTEQILRNSDWAERDARNLFDSIKRMIPERTKEGRPITVDDVCSALVRPMLIPRDGCTFIPCDFSQIEARLAAWAADEGKMIEAFRERRDLYKEFAAELFNVSLSEVTELQRQISKSAVLGCQYGLGPDKFRVYAANSGADLSKAGITAEQVIEKYRKTYQRICGWKPDPKSNFRVGGVWQTLDKGIKHVVETGEPRTLAKCDWFRYRNDLCCKLPSGRIVYYPNARIEDVIPPYVYTLGLPHIPKATVVFDSAKGIKSLYGGLAFENVIQGMARDLLCHAGVLIESKGMPIVLHVHDEIVAEVPTEHANRYLHTMVECMSDVPNWAEGLPLECEGFTVSRFVKKAFSDSIKLSTKDLHK